MAEGEIREAKTRDTAEKQALIRQHITERKRIQKTIARVRQHQRDTLYGLSADIANAIAMGRVPASVTQSQESQKDKRNRKKSRDQGPDYEPTQ